MTVATMAFTARRQEVDLGAQEVAIRAGRAGQRVKLEAVMVQDVDGWAVGTGGCASDGAVAGAVGGVERVGEMAGVVHCLPISIPIKKSRMQSSTTQVAAIATMREVIVKTY